VLLPVPKIEFAEQDLGVSRITSAKHLDTLATQGFVEKTSIGRSNCCINRPEFERLTHISLDDDRPLHYLAEFLMQKVISH